MVISPPVALQGCQRPRLLAEPVGVVSSAGQEAAELAAVAGLVLDPWQRLALDVALGERADRKWAAFEVGIVVSRQNGKGSILEARELAGLFLFGERLILHSAHEFKTAAEAFLRVKALVDNTDDLRRQVARVRTSHGDEGIELLSGARLRFVARSRGSGRGFSGDCVVLDEAYNLGPEAMGALLPTLSARANPQVWYTSSAPMASSVQLHAVRRRALAGGSERLAYLEWSAPADCDPADPEAWRLANPALGFRVQAEFVRAELDAMPLAEFRRERLGVPDDEPSEGGGVIPVDVWMGLADSRSEWVGRPVGVADVSPDGGCSLVLAGVRADGLRHVELVDHRQGTGWVAQRRAELDARYQVGAWLRDPAGPAVELEGDWRDLSGREWAEASTGFLRAVIGPEVPEGEGFRWRCSADLERPLLDAVRGAVRRERGDGAEVWARRRSSVDISPLVALSLGWWAAGLPLPSDPLGSFW